MTFNETEFLQRLYINTCRRLLNKRDELERQNKVLRGALETYIDKELWAQIAFSKGPSYVFLMDAKPWTVAEKALEEVNGKA